MRVIEVLGLRPIDIFDGKLLLHEPKSGREKEVVFIPRKLCIRLENYTRNQNLKADQRIFPLTYAGARKVVVKTGDMLGVKLRPHDLRRHAATYASRAGVQIEIISKVSCDTQIFQQHSSILVKCQISRQSDGSRTYMVSGEQILNSCLLICYSTDCNIKRFVD